MQGSDGGEEVVVRGAVRGEWRERTERWCSERGGAMRGGKRGGALRSLSRSGGTAAGVEGSGARGGGRDESGGDGGLPVPIPRFER